jgi:hypothetical protein
VFANFLFPGFISLALVIICAVHCIRGHKEYWWLIIIFLLGDIGCIIYIVCELYPDLKRGRGRKSPLGKLKSNKRRICELEDELSHVNTVEKRAELAHAYMTAKMYDDAIAAYKDCLVGNHTDDAYLLFGLAKTYFEAGQYDATEESLQAIDKTESKDKKDERDLLRARGFAAAGRHDDARQQYEKTMMTFSGAEAKCRYAMFLRDNGDKERAVELFGEIVSTARRGTTFYRDNNREWIKIAKKNT